MEHIAKRQCKDNHFAKNIFPSSAYQPHEQVSNFQFREDICYLMKFYYIISFADYLLFFLVIFIRKKKNGVNF